jgi:hypothetical protein
MNEHVKAKLDEFAVFFNGAAALTDFPMSATTIVHAYCDNCTTCVDGTSAWLAHDVDLVLCAACYSALHSLRQPADRELCKKLFRMEGFTGKWSRVVALRHWFELRAAAQSQ